MSPSAEHVTILLSIHDGGRWLDALLDSVRRQSHRNWTLLVRDDASKDRGLDIVARHAADDERITVVDDDRGHLGPAASFMSLLDRVEAGYFAFCDQDDVWFPHKLSWSLDALASAPPIAAVATDAEVVDADGQTTSPSALAQRGVRGRVDMGRLLINNVAVGATMLGTAELAQAAVEASRGHDLHMHDWWTALVAEYAGALKILPAPTLAWRRHSTTVTGSTPSTLRGRARRRLDYLAWSVRAAEMLRDSDLEPISAGVRRPVDGLVAAGPTPNAMGMVRARRAGVRAWPWYRQIGLVVSVLVSRWVI